MGGYILSVDRKVDSPISGTALEEEKVLRGYKEAFLKDRAADRLVRSFLKI